MRYIILLMTFVLFGCSTTQSSPAVKAADLTPPAGVVEIMKDDKVITYVDLRTVSTYQNKPHLRRFYMINNYVDITVIRDIPFTSSRVSKVINCETQEVATFERIHFTEAFAEGDVIRKTKPFGKWESYAKDSILDYIGGLLCQIELEKLQPEPAKDTRPPMPLFDF